MKNILSTALLALTMMGGVAAADRGHGDHGDRGRNHSGATVRGGVTVNVRGGYRAPARQQRQVRVQRQRVYNTGGRFTFGGGVERRYVRPTFQTHYYSYRARPTVYVEQMAPVEGYIWVNGDWSWSGREWIWQAGHYEPDASYQYDTYNNGGY